jgi:hypothetical protein
MPPEAKNPDEPEQPGDAPQLDPHTKSIVEAWNYLVPRLDKVQALVAAGWLHAEPQECLIDTLIREITLLRAERLAPAVIPDLSAIILGAFMSMCMTLRANLNDPAKSIQQHRYAAFEQAIAGVLPTFVGRGRVEAFSAMKAIIELDIKDAERVIGILKSQEVVQSPFVAKRIQFLETNIGFLRSAEEMVVGLMTGGLTPEQALAKSKSARAHLAEAPAANAIN